MGAATPPVSLERRPRTPGTPGVSKGPAQRPLLKGSSSGILGEQQCDILPEFSIGAMSSVTINSVTTNPGSEIFSCQVDDLNNTARKLRDEVTSMEASLRQELVRESKMKHELEVLQKQQTKQQASLSKLSNMVQRSPPVVSRVVRQARPGDFAFAQRVDPVDGLGLSREERHAYNQCKRVPEVAAKTNVKSPTPHSQDVLNEWSRSLLQPHQSKAQSQQEDAAKAQIEEEATDKAKVEEELAAQAAVEEEVASTAKTQEKDAAKAEEAKSEDLVSKGLLFSTFMVRLGELSNKFCKGSCHGILPRHLAMGSCQGTKKEIVVDMPELPEQMVGA